ncbi:hypothetical protein [Corallincola spongiicola]|uniref:Uncharacterized protein n=1 Tax=Corallincola spongiicola TaxID=2520508 RepID=A0ABY1WLY1_9GAMM|nr:hypothetical protein [Corallincola spongiicola]TAA41807.1 hypothetical protein EXY25_16360 [Corallincola spongiicola]
MFLRTIISVLLLAGSVACEATTSAVKDTAAICQQYNSGDAIAVVGNAKPDDSEWYADWSAYLNDFAMANADKITVYHSSNHPEFNVSDYTVFFAKKGHPSFIISEAVEPQYYEYVAMTYSGEVIPASISAFKAETPKTDEIAVYCGQ